MAIEGFTDLRVPDVKEHPENLFIHAQKAATSYAFLQFCQKYSWLPSFIMSICAQIWLFVGEPSPQNVAEATDAILTKICEDNKTIKEKIQREKQNRPVNIPAEDETPKTVLIWDAIFSEITAQEFLDHRKETVQKINTIKSTVLSKGMPQKGPHDSILENIDRMPIAPHTEVDPDDVDSSSED